MLRKSAAQVLAQHILSEAVARGQKQITDEFARDVIAEATMLQGTKWDHVYRAAIARPAFSRVKAEARRIITRAQG